MAIKIFVKRGEEKENPAIPGGGGQKRLFLRGGIELNQEGVYS